MNRIDRISAILIQLQSRRVVKAADIAERFNISLRTVYRDVKTLEEAGVPVIGEAGVGYSIMDGYRLPPVMFTKEEATAFLTAEKFVEKLTDAYTVAHHQSAMFKVRAVLRSADKNMLEDMDAHIAVLRSKPMRHAEIDQNSLQPILNGIINKNVLAIEYFAMHSQQHTTRCIEPVGIFFLENFWHLIGYCRLRNDYRDFRVDRIKKLTVTDERFNNQHITLKQYLTKVADEQKLHTVIIQVDKEVVKHINEQKYYSGFVSQMEYADHVEMTFLTYTLEGFARWYLMFGDQARVISPDSLRERIKAILEEMIKNIGTADLLLT